MEKNKKRFVFEREREREKKAKLSDGIQSNQKLMTYSHITSNNDIFRYNCRNFYSFFSFNNSEIAVVH